MMYASKSEEELNKMTPDEMKEYSTNVNDIYDELYSKKPDKFCGIIKNSSNTKCCAIL